MDVSMEEENDDAGTIPHAVPVVTDYLQNKNAGRPIQFDPQASPQEHVTGRLAHNGCFQMADFINSVGLTSSQRDTFLKLELVRNLLKRDEVLTSI
jgi:hypothetical protein